MPERIASAFALALLACKPSPTAPPVDAIPDPAPPRAFGLLHVIEGHQGHVWSAGYGRRVLAVAVRDNGESNLWDLRAGESIARLAEAGHNPKGFAIDADAGLVLGAIDDEVWLWNADDLQGPREVPAGDGLLHGLSFAERGDAFLVQLEDQATLAPKTGSSAAKTLALTDVRWAVLAPRGDRILASLRHGTSLLDASDGHAIFESREAEAAIFDRDGARMLAMAGRRCTLVDASTGKQLAKVDAGKKCMRVEFSRDGSLAAVSGANKTVVLDAKTGKVKRSFAGKHGVAEGNRVAVASDGAVVVYALDTGARVAQVHSEGSPVALDPTGGVVVVDDVLSTSVWTIADGNIVDRFEQTRSPAAQFADDGGEMLLHTERESSPAILLRLPSGERIGAVGEQQFAVEDLAVSPDGRRVAIAGGRGLRIVDAESGATKTCGPRDPKASPAYVRAVFVGSDRVAAGTAMDVHGAPPIVDLVDVESCATTKTIDHVAANVLDPILHADPKGRAIVARRGDADDNAVVLGLDPSGKVKELATVRSLGFVALHPDGKELALGTADGVVDRRGRKLPEPAAVRTDALAFSPDGRLLAAAGIDRGVWLVDVDTWTVARTLVPPSDASTRASGAGKDDLAAVAVAFAGPERLVVGVPGGELHVYDLATGEAAFELPQGEVATAFAVSSDARWIAVARGPHCGPQESEEGGDPRCGLGQPRAIEIRDAQSLEPVIALESHYGSVVELAFSPTGNVLASGGADHRVAIWSLPASAP